MSLLGEQFTMIKGMLFDIQRGSMVDGEGIRTTVFFKGCNLRCTWCHNPESQCYSPECLFDKNKCTACGKCAATCPQNACENILIDRTLCIGCGKCADVCADGAKTLCGKYMSVVELFSEIEKDKKFYEVSGGGVTFSGGEPLLQPLFLIDICKMCSENKINVNIDTAGFIPWQNIECVLPYADVFLFDIKAITDTLHIHGTGCSNKIILENLNKLDNSRKKYKYEFRLYLILITALKKYPRLQTTFPHYIM